MPRKRRYNPDGTRVARLVVAAPARPRKVAYTHAGKSGLRRGGAQIDRRTREARFENDVIAQRVLHLGGRDAITEPLMSVVRHSARLELLVALAWGHVLRAGVLNQEGDLSGAFQAFLSAGRELRSVLETIGLERKAKPVLTLQEYLNEEISDA